MKEKETTDKGNYKCKKKGNEPRKAKWKQQRKKERKN